MAYTTIDDPSAHFQVSLWTGDGNDNRSIDQDGNSTFQPDLIWIKSRGGTQLHYMYDSTRGANVQLLVDDSAAETTVANRMQAFESDGFQLGTSSEVNYVGGLAYVGWQWLANAGSRTTNTQSGDNPGGGYQANTTAGFSIVDFTGTGGNGTMAHGLGAVPQVIMLKSRSGAHDWQMGHNSIASDAWTDYLNPNTNGAAADNDTHWNDTAPTSTVFTLGENAGLNGDGLTNIAYLWTPIKGFSQFGGYKGNGNTDGTFVHLGFKPAFLIIKKTSATQDWQVRDHKRDAYNEDSDELLFMSTDGATTTSGNNIADFLSNGFKLRGTGGDHNEDGGTFVYLAFAEQPFVTSGGIPCTAR